MVQIQIFLLWLSVAFVAYLVAWVWTYLRAGERESIGDIEALYPYQVETVRRLTGACDRLPGREFSSISLKGGWGAGKSAILRTLPTTGGDKSVYVYFDAWAHEGDRNLEFSIFRRIAYDPRVMSTVGLGVPLFTVAFHSLLLAFPTRLKLFGVESQIQASSTIPTVRWRHELAAIAKRVHDRGRRIVVILDEIDRCSHSAVQVYFTLIRRFLDVNSIVVVMPDVGDTLRAKAFHPAFPLVGDLRDTLLADALLRDEIYGLLEPDLVERDTTPEGLVHKDASTKETSNGANWLRFRDDTFRQFMDRKSLPIRKSLRRLERKYIPVAGVDVCALGMGDIEKVVEDVYSTYAGDKQVSVNPNFARVGRLVYAQGLPQSPAPDVLDLIQSATQTRRQSGTSKLHGDVQVATMITAFLKVISALK